MEAAFYLPVPIKYSISLIVVHVHATVFQRVIILQTASNQEVTLKRLISTLWTGDCSKAICLGVK